MAKKPAVNKSQAIRDHFSSHPGAMPAEVVAALKKQGITVKPGLVSIIKSKLNKAGKLKKAAEVKVLAEAAVPAVIDKPAKPGDTITLEQIRKVAQTINLMGGFHHMVEILDVIKETGGVKKFKDLAEAMACPEAEVVVIEPVMID